MPKCAHPAAASAAPRAARLLAGALAVTITAGTLSAQGAAADSAAIVRLIEAGNIPKAPGRVFWSGAYPRPTINGLTHGGPDTGKPAVALPAARMTERRDTRLTARPVRIEVARAGDLAYEFSDFTMSYALPGEPQRREWTGSLLRVWRKLDGQWKEAALFARPHADATTSATAAARP